MIYAREEEGETERNGVKKDGQRKIGRARTDSDGTVMVIVVMVSGGGLVSMLEGIDSIEKSDGQ